MASGVPNLPGERLRLASPLSVIAAGNVRTLNRPGVFTVPYLDGFELNHTVSRLRPPSSPDPARPSARWRKGKG